MTSPAKRPRNRKSLILAEAARLFAERGYAAVRVDEIGAAVGVSGPAVYRHFPSKQHLLGAVVIDAAEAFATALAGAEPDAAVVARRSVGVALDRPDRLAVYVRYRARLDGAQRDDLRRIERDVQRVWSEVLRTTAPERADVRAVRMAGVLGALGALARGPARLARLPRPRLDDLLTASIAAAATGPPACPGSAPGDPPWALPVSKRDEILTAALRLSVDRGFGDVGIDEIGEAVGITGPTVYHYVESKADLLVDAYDRVGQRVVVGIEQALEGARSADDALDRLCRSYAAIAIASADLIVVTSREGFSLPEVDRPRLARRRRGVHDAWAAVLAELRPELAEPELRELVRLVFQLQNQAALAVPDEVGLTGELAGMARRWCLGGLPIEP